MTVTRLASRADDLCVAVRRIALERGFNRAFADYAAATARAHTGGDSGPHAPYVATAIGVLDRRYRETPAQYQDRARRNPIAAVVLDGITDASSMASPR